MKITKYKPAAYVDLLGKLVAYVREDKEGFMVAIEDHGAAMAEKDAEIARLRKAGDMLLDITVGFCCDESLDPPDDDGMWDAWWEETDKNARIANSAWYSAREPKQ